MENARHCLVAVVARGTNMYVSMNVSVCKYECNYSTIKVNVIDIIKKNRSMNINNVCRLRSENSDLSSVYWNNGFASTWKNSFYGPGC